MIARCALCARRLRVPSPDGYGPVCRRKLTPAAGRTAGQEDVTGTAPGDGQTALPVQLTLPRPPYPTDRVWRGRRLIDTDTKGLT